MLRDFSKTVSLKDGTVVLLRPMVVDDFVKLLHFFRTLPEEDRHFLREDVTDREVIERWCRDLDYDVTLPILAEFNEEIVGDATLHMNRRGWERDVGQVRCVIARNFQKKGLATIMIGELFGCAVEKGLDKLTARMTADQKGAIRAFEKIGFIQEAQLKDYVTDLTGKKHDLVIMTNSVETLWKKMENFVIDSETRMEE